LNKTNFKSYNRVLIVGTALLLLTTATFNRVVDPFQYFGSPRIKGFNEVKSRLRFFEREVKPAVVKREQPEAVILGSSIAEIGFEPLHPALTCDGHSKSYNFGIAGAPWKETFCNLKYVLANTDVKRIVFGMLYHPMPNEDCERNLATMNENRLPEMLVSPQAIHHSRKTLSSQNPREPFTHTAQGRFLFTRYDPNVEDRARHFLEKILQGKTTCSEGRLRHSLDEPTKPLALDDSTPFDLSGLAHILAQVSGRDIQLRIVLYPRHVVLAEADYLCDEAQQRWVTMFRIARYIEQHPPTPPASVELWDFQGYGPQFAEPLGGGVLTFWQDIIHFNPELGDLMLDAMFGVDGIASDPITGFGYRVDSATLSTRYQWLSDQRRAFLSTHPETWDTLMRLLSPQVRQSQTTTICGGL
jgi:hypothetical protein